MAAHGEHQVDGVKQAGQGLGQIGRLEGLQGVLQGLLRTALTHTHTHQMYATTWVHVIDMTA